jgi:hypothetical protein
MPHASNPASIFGIQDETELLGATSIEEGIV